MFVSEQAGMFACTERVGTSADTFPHGSRETTFFPSGGEDVKLTCL